jgi:DNA-binding MarR family transcriptional regulator
LIPTTYSPDPSAAAELDLAAESLVAVFAMARERAHLRLSSSQLQALLVVEREEGLNLRALADGMGMILSSASRLVDRLVAAGVLERGPSQLDRREISLTLTPAGRDLLHELRADRRRRLDAILDRMSPAARTALLKGLREFSQAAARTTLPVEP